MGTAGGHAVVLDGRVYRGRNGLAGINGDRLPLPPPGSDSGDREHVWLP